MKVGSQVVAPGAFGVGVGTAFDLIFPHATSTAHGPWVGKGRAKRGPEAPALAAPTDMRHQAAWLLFCAVLGDCPAAVTSVW
jgi:hypothetical protein